MGKVKNMFNQKWRGIRITKLMARDGCNCKLCGEPLDRKIRDDKSPRYITFDHKLPRSKGGDDKIKNLQLAHQECNNARGNDPILPMDENWFDAA